MVFSKKNILIPNVAEKNVLILVEGKKKSDSEFLSYNLMLNSGKKIRTLHDKKNKYSNSCVVRKVEWSVPNQNRNENNHPVKFICDLLIRDLVIKTKVIYKY